MEIIYHGDASFLLKAEPSVAINPTAAAGADIALHSERRNARRLIVNGPGEYEIGGALIVTLRPDKQASHCVHAVNLDGVNVLHSSQSSISLTDGDLTAIGKVDVLIIASDDLKAAEALAVDLSPRVLIPFGPNAEQLCAMLGAREAPAQARFAWNGTGNPPRAVLLKAQTAPRKRASKAA
jgi:hypothetical protein